MGPTQRALSVGATQEEAARWRRVSDAMLHALRLFFLPQAMLAFWHVLVPAVGMWCSRRGGC